VTSRPLSDEEIRRLGFEPTRHSWVPVDPSDNGRRTSWTARDLLATEFPEPRYAVPDLIPEGLSFLAGAPKLGKSWLMLSVALGVANGGRVLGKLPVDRGEALYLAMEDTPRRLKGRMQLVLEGQEAPEGLHFETEWPRLAEGGAEQIGEWLTAHPDTRLVVIDVFSRLRARLDSERSDRFMTDYIAGESIKAIADGNRVAVVALHHTRKAAAEDFVDTISGTHGLAASADTIMVAKRGRGQADATLYVTGRDVEEQELALKFDPLIGSWTLLGEAAEYAIGETRKLILDAIRDHGPLTPKQAADVTGVSHDLARQTMRRMAQDGQLVGKDGRYALCTPVTAVTPSLEEGTEGDAVTRVTGPEGSK
jgi:AAA domain